MTTTDLLVVDSLADAPVRPTALAAPAPAADGLPLDAIRANLLKWEPKYRAANAPATMRAVRGDWQTFLQWAIHNRVWVLPVASDDLVRYLTDLVVTGKKRATINRALNTIRLIHKAAGLGDPTEYPGWKLEWKGLVRKLADVGANAPRQAKAMQAASVTRILSALGDSLLELRDAALISLASDSLCRESELVALRVEDFEPSGADWAVDLRRSKTDQEALGSKRFCSAATKARIDAWCTAAGIRHGFVFRRVGRKVDVDVAALPRNPPLAPPQVARIFRTRAKQAGIKVRFTGHSTRVGSAVDLLEAEFATTSVRFAGGWKSDRMVLRYGQGARVGRGAMAKLRRGQGPGNPSHD